MQGSIITRNFLLTSALSHPIISPKDTWWHRQYVGSLGSTGMSSTSLEVSLPKDGLPRPDALRQQRNQGHNQLIRVQLCMLKL